MSTDPSRARISRIYASTWLVIWEDWMDGDFDDALIEIALEHWALACLGEQMNKPTRILLALSLGLALLSTIAVVRGVAQTQAEHYELLDVWNIQDPPGEFHHPQGLAADQGSYLYIVDQGNNRLHKLSPWGEFLFTWGEEGTGPGQFSSPHDVVVSSAGRVYVTDGGNHRVQVFATDGAYLTEWGTEGTFPGQFDEPWGIALDGSGQVYVTDRGTHRVQVFTEDGRFVTEWGRFGRAAGQFRFPEGITVDAWAKVYVADRGNHRIQKFHADGLYMLQWGQLGGGPGQFVGPSDVDASHIAPWVFVADRGNSRIQSFGNDGRFEAEWGGDWFQDPVGIAADPQARYVYLTNDLSFGPRVMKYTLDGGMQARWGETSSFDRPEEIAISGDGSLFLATNNGRLRELDPQGTLVEVRACDWVLRDVAANNRWETWGLLPHWLAQLRRDCETVWVEGNQGSLPGRLDLALGLDRDAQNNLYVADGRNHRVQKFSSDGHVLAVWGSQGNAPGQFFWPTDVAVGGGFLYVGEAGNARIQKLTLNGQSLQEWPVPGGWPRSLAADEEGNVYILLSNEKVQKYSPDGAFLAGWGERGTEPGQFYGARGITVGSDGTVYVSDWGNRRVQLFQRGTIVGTPSPTPTPTPRPGEPTEPCTVMPDKMADPTVVDLGEEITITLSLSGHCPVGSAIADVMLVLDHSGSMSGTIATAQEAAQIFVNQMDLSQNQVGLVAFNHIATLDHLLSHDGASVQAAIDALEAGGGTDIAGAIRTAQVELESSRHNPEAQTVIVLLSDGLSDATAARLAALEAKAVDTRLLAIGLGEDADEMLLLDVSSAPSDYYFAPTAAQLQAIYSEIAGVIQQDTMMHEASIRDLVSPDVVFVGGSGVPAPVVNEGELSWYQPTVNATGITLTYRIQPQVPGTYPANTSATADYLDSLGRSASLDFPNPIITVRAPTPTPTATPTPTPTSTATPTPTPSMTPTPTPTERAHHEAYLPALLKDLCIVPPPTDSNTLILPQDGTVVAIVLSSEADCPGTFDIVSPIADLVFPDYEEVGARSELGRFTCGTELIFSITPSGYCGPGNTYLSKDPSRCQVRPIGPTSWELHWEDWIDGDYNDTVILIELIP